MHDQFKLTRKDRRWHLMARNGEGFAKDTTWVSLGGCPDQIVAVRVWLSLLARKGLR